MELRTYQEYINLLEKDTISIIELYTPWCSKCKIWKKKLESFNIYNINIDDDEFIDHLEFNSISNVPQVWIIKNKKIIKLVNNNIDEVINYINNL
jgi:hypothetical protein